MSHFTAVKTQLVEETYLIQALKDLGYTSQVGRSEIRGHGGRTPVDIKITSRNPGYDVGFRRGPDGYELVADWWGVRDINPRQFVQQLNQRYAYHAARAKLEEQGFNLVAEETQQDGRIHLLLRRMA